jgi:hypothetical protein
MNPYLVGLLLSAASGLGAFYGMMLLSKSKERIVGRPR